MASIHIPRERSFRQAKNKGGSFVEGVDQHFLPIFHGAIYMHPLQNFPPFQWVINTLNKKPGGEGPKVGGWSSA